jgi:hypothetical protein
MERQDPDVDAEVEAARAEAAAIGGVAGDEDLDPADRPVLEGGGGVAEGFEQAEDALVEHASHGDEYPSRAALHDAFTPEEAGVTAEDAEADDIRTSEHDPGAEYER